MPHWTIPWVQLVVSRQSVELNSIVRRSSDWKPNIWTDGIESLHRLRLEKIWRDLKHAHTAGWPFASFEAQTSVQISVRPEVSTGTGDCSVGRLILLRTSLGQIELIFWACRLADSAEEDQGYEPQICLCSMGTVFRYAVRAAFSMPLFVQMLSAWSLQFHSHYSTLSIFTCALRPLRTPISPPRGYRLQSLSSNLSRSLRTRIQRIPISPTGDVRTSQARSGK